jgi:hypothetical protein
MDRLPHAPIPQLGLARSDVLAQLLAMKQGDQDWRGGRVFSLVYSAGDGVHELLQDAQSLYSAENGLNVLAFPSIGIMQHDIVRNTATLLGADDPAAGGAVEGYLTSGGTESLLQAVKTARDVARQDRGIRNPSVVAAESAHAAFTRRRTTSTSSWSASRSARTSESTSVRWPMPAPTPPSWWSDRRRPTPRAWSIPSPTSPRWPRSGEFSATSMRAWVGSSFLS